MHESKSRYNPTGFHLKSVSMENGFIIDSVAVFEMLKIFWLSVESLFLTKLSVVGVTNLGLHMLERSRNIEAHLETHGTWMRLIS